MSGATCPACGVAVVPGYVRCPNKKCRKPLPRRQSTVVEGGTALESNSRVPAIAALAAAILVGGGLMVYFATRSNETKAAPTAPVAAPVEEARVESTGSIVPAETTPDEVAATPTGPNAQDVARGLEQELKRQQLFGTVTVTGTRADVRSGLCGDPGMTRVLDGAASGFKAAGLTKLRCVEQSGRVVSDRDL